MDLEKIITEQDLVQMFLNFDYEYQQQLYEDFYQKYDYASSILGEWTAGKNDSFIDLMDYCKMVISGTVQHEEHNCILGPAFLTYLSGYYQGLKSNE